MYCWTVEGVKIFETASVKIERNTTTITGTGFYTREKSNSFIPFTYHATALANGWYITIIANTGRIGEFQGYTFNLPLEVSAATRRLL